MNIIKMQQIIKAVATQLAPVF